MMLYEFLKVIVMQFVIIGFQSMPLVQMILLMLLESMALVTNVILAARSEGSFSMANYVTRILINGFTCLLLIIIFVLYTSDVSNLNGMPIGFLMQQIFIVIYFLVFGISLIGFLIRLAQAIVAFTQFVSEMEHTPKIKSPGAFQYVKKEVPQSDSETDRKSLDDFDTEYVKEEKSTKAPRRRR